MCEVFTSASGRRRAAPPVAITRRSYCTSRPDCVRTMRCSRSIDVAHSGCHVSTFSASKSSGFTRRTVSISASPESTAFDNGGRSYGRWISSAIITRRPSKPSLRKVFTTQPAAWPPPITTIVRGASSPACAACAFSAAASVIFPLRHELAFRRLRVFLATCIAVDATVDRPLGEYGRTRFEIARLPFGRELVFVGVVLDQTASRILEVPEVRRRHWMTSRPELRIPAATADMHAAAEHFVDVAHGEGNVIQTALAARQRQQKNIVVAAMWRTA